MIAGALAKRYAKALLSLAGSPTQRDKFDEGIHDFVKACNTADTTGTRLGSLLESNRIKPSQRQAVAKAVCQRLSLDATLIKFIDLLMQRDRVGGIEQIARHYRELADRDGNRVRAHVRSAKPLAADAGRKIQTALESSTGKTVVLTHSVDETLIGGLVTQVGSLTLDRSVKRQLEALRADLGA